MPKSKATPLTVHLDFYYNKQLAYKSGYRMPESEWVEYLRDTTSTQLENYIAGFGPFNKAWNEYVKGILQQHNVSPLQYALYRAFMNEYMKKVMGLRKGHPTMTKDEVIAKFERLGASREILESIANALEGHAQELL